MIYRNRLPDGTLELRRPRYQAAHYTMTPRDLEMLRGTAEWQSFSDAVGEHDGGLRGYHEIGRFERDGKQWVMMQDNGSEVIAELELKPNGDIGEVRPVPPERAWQIIRELDKKLRPGIIVEE